MQCHQCSKPAIYRLSSGILLCVDCCYKHNQITQSQLNAAREEANYLMDQMWDAVGLPGHGPRYSTQQPINVGDVNLQDIEVKDSVVGMINTGNMRIIDTCITALKNTGNENFADAITALTKAVITKDTIQSDIRNEILEILGFLSHEGTLSKNNQRKSVIKPLLARFKEILKVDKQLTQLWEKYGSIVESVFS